MSNWKDSTVADVTKYQKAGGTPVATNPAYYGGDIPFVVIEDITKSSRFLEETEKSLSIKGLTNSAAWLIQEPHILYSMYATVGKPIINKIPCTTNQAIIALKENELIDQEFLYYQLLFIRPSVYKYTAQTTQSNLNAGVVKRLPISYPSNKSVQKKIALILRTIDQAIEKTEALIEKYQQIKAGLMHDLFTRGIGADGKLRLSHEQAPELYQQTPIGWIPKEWEIKSITSFADVIDPNPSHRNPIYHDEGFPFISTVEFDDFDQIRLDTSRRVIEGIVLEQERRCKFSGFSIAFSRKGTIGETRLLPSHLRFALLDSLCVINPISINSLFLFYSLRSFLLKRQIKNMTMGQALPQMSLGRVRDLLIPAPISDVEQEKIESKLATIDQFIFTNGKELHKLKSKKFGLMHDLLTGKVAVQIDESEQEST